MGARYRRIERVADKLDSWAEMWDNARIAEVFGTLNVGLGDSRKAGNCDGGTDRFAKAMRREWELLYGTPTQRTYAPVAVVLNLYERAREHGSIGHSYRLFLLCAIASAIVRANRDNEV